MKTESQQKFILPDLTDLYTKKWIIWNGCRIKTVFIIHLLDQFLSKWTGYRRDWIRLNSRVLKKEYGSIYTYILDWLIQNGHLELWKNYSVGIKSKTYRLTQDAKSKPILAATIQIPQKLAKIKLDDSNIELDWVRLELIEGLKQVQIDRNAAIEWCDKNIDRNSIQYLSNIMSINRISNCSIYSHTDKWGRLHTNFTSLKKEIRQQFLSVNGNKLVELDIKNSQPFFLWLLMRENGCNGDSGYTESIFNGQIYDQLSSEIGCNRSEAKIAIYKVLFGRNKTNQYDQWFQSKWPITYQWILDYKAECKSYKALAQRLQKRESQFIFNHLIPEIYKWHKPIIITVHDSILFEEQWYNDVKRIFGQALDQLVKSWKY